MTWQKTEFGAKLGRIRAMMDAQGLESLLITQQINFLWLTGGRPYVNIASERACGDLLVTKGKIYLIASNVEADRLADEELKGIDVERVIFPWWSPSGPEDRLRDLTGGKPVPTDVELGAGFSRLRWRLLPAEQTRFRDTARGVADALEQAAFEMKRGDTETSVACLIKRFAQAADLIPLVVLVAGDERAATYRHPLPTERRIEKFGLLSLSAQKHGLVASATRLVHFGKIPEDLQRRHEAVSKIDVMYIANTLPGAKLKEILEKGRWAYDLLGYGDEWKNHHQGGLAGYLSRELRVNFVTEDSVEEGQVYAWNPTLPGVKSEDSVLVERDGAKVITDSASFPTMTVEFAGRSLKRPAILKR